MSRDLRPIPLSQAFGNGPVITMSAGQWDALLSTAYEQGWTLLELDVDERPVRAYRKGVANVCDRKTIPDSPEER